MILSESSLERLGDFKPILGMIAMKKLSIFALAAGLLAAPAMAGPVFVGSWTVDQGP